MWRLRNVRFNVAFTFQLDVYSFRESLQFLCLLFIVIFGSCIRVSEGGEKRDARGKEKSMLSYPPPVQVPY